MKTYQHGDIEWIGVSIQSQTDNFLLLRCEGALYLELLEYLLTQGLTVCGVSPGPSGEAMICCQKQKQK